jgi:tripartite-type tricarboxylate transporter receptor subunit TctC
LTCPADLPSSRQRTHRRGNAMTIRLLAAVWAFMAVLSPLAFAQSYPTQNIRIIISFGPGGGTDIVGRILGQRLQEKLGQPVVIENRPGAGGLLGNEAVANAPKDGYTLGIMTAGQIIASVMSKTPRYDTLKAFDSVGQIATAGLVIAVRPDDPSNSVKDLIAAAKAAPGKLVFASPGYGATQHLAAELFKQVAGVDMLHVPYRTSPEALSALLSKQVDVIIETVSALLGQIESGQVKALAVTGKDRFPALARLPTAMESGGIKDYDVTTWYGLFGPHGMPKPVIDKLNSTLNEILQEAPIRERLTKAGVVVRSSTPEAFQQFMAEEYAKWDKVRQAANLQQR